MLCSSFIPLINRPTRITENSATLIDNIFTNCHNVSNHITGIIPTDVSDHFSIFHVLFNNLCSQENDIKIYKRTVNDQTISSCKVKLQNTDWGNVVKTNDLEMLYNIFHERFNNAVNEYMLLQHIKFNNKNLGKPWITKGLLTSIV